MQNLQLYRTNVLLGGQMKYDLVLQSNGDDIKIKDFHISAISKSAPTNKYVKDELLNYTHQENIQKYYDNNLSSFYKDFVNPMLNSLYPLPDNYNGEKYDSTYEMGCKRTSYQLYNKQFEFFCPLWLECIDDITKLSFEFRIKTNFKQLQPILSKRVQFQKEDKITKYFQNYIEYLDLNRGCDWVFDINDKYCVASGLNVKTGLVSNVRLMDLYSDLISRERPLMEFNNMIINKLNENNLIAKQLFNFNFCFELEDILPPFLYRELKNYPLYIDIVVYYNGEQLEVCDFFSNHEYIGKSYTNLKCIKLTADEQLEFNNPISESINVLDYLQDYNCIDLIDKNKVLQNTHHWCLSNNPDCHFNFYNGFSQVFRKFENDKYEDIDIPYYNTDTANLFIQNSIFKTKNDIYFSPWCNTYEVDGHLSTMKLEEKIALEAQKYSFLFSKFSKNCWVKNINYQTESISSNRNINVLLLFEQGLNQANVANFKTLNAYGWSLIPNIPISFGNIQCKISIALKDDDSSGQGQIIFLIDKSIQSKTLCLYKNFVQYAIPSITEYMNNSIPKISNNLLNDFFNIIQSPNLDVQKYIPYENGLKIVPAEGPVIDIEEIMYYKDLVNNCIVRTFGKIKPYFITKDSIHKNFQYNKCKLNEVEDTYKKYSSTIYLPQYPSIKYFPLKKENINYNIQSELDSLDSLEFHHYHDNKIIYLIPEIELMYTTEDGTKKDIEEYIDKQIRDQIYPHLLSDDQDDKIFNYIKEKYVWKSTHINSIIDEMQKLAQQYIYKIQIKLK